VPFGDEPTIRCPKYHQAASDSWQTDFLYVYCLEEFQQVLVPIVSNCILEVSCRCNLFLRQPPKLKGSASYTVFDLTFNINQFTLNGMTLYEKYKLVVRSSLVPNHRTVSTHISRINPSVWNDEYCSSWGKHHLSWNDKHHSSCARFHSFVYISTT